MDSIFKDKIRNMKFNCKCIDNQWGNFICFVSSSYEKVDIENEISKGAFTFCSVVLLNESENVQLENLIQILQKYFKNINLCVCGNVNKSYLEKVFNIKKSYSLRSITFSINNYYNVRDLNIDEKIEIGIERWSNGLASDQLAQIDIPYCIQLEDIKRLENRIKDVVVWINNYKPESNLEKIILFDYWMQKNVQYIKERESPAGDVVYICDSMNRESRAEDVLINHFGRCEDIAFTAALVLNHPDIGVNCRQVSTGESVKYENHSWNIVNCDGKEYFCDFTHNITRNPCKIKGALKAKQYSPNHTLFGKIEAENQYCISDCYDTMKISDVSYDKSILLNTVKKLFSSYTPVFPEEFVMESYSVRK